MKRIALAAIALLVAGMMVCAAWPSAPAQAHAQIDPTMAYLDSLKMQRQGEIAATQAAIRAAQATRQAEQQATAWALSVQATEDARVARMTTTAQAAATQATQATATRSAQSTATAEWQATRSAAGTATATAQIAAAQIAWQKQQDEMAAQRRQRLIDQVRQGVFVLGILMLLGFAGMMMRVTWVRLVPPPSKPVVVVEHDTDLGTDVPRTTEDETPMVTFDPVVAQCIIEQLRDEG